jgi:hypothetical protein
MFGTKSTSLGGSANIEEIQLPRYVSNKSSSSELISFQDFVSRLKEHLLERLLGQQYDGVEVSFTPEERNSVMFVNNRIYKHKVMRVNYATYDLRRAQDSLNSRTHPDIMVLSHEDDGTHPYWFA